MTKTLLKTTEKSTLLDLKRPGFIHSDEINLQVNRNVDRDCEEIRGKPSEIILFENSEVNCKAIISHNKYKTYDENVNAISKCDSAQEKCFHGETKLPKGFKFGELSSDKKYLILCCILSHFMSGLSTSLLAPFYPQVARRKGMSLALIGLTFSIFPAVSFFISPIIGLYMTRLGPKFLVISGLATGGVCNCLYGLLDKSPAGTPFIVTSILCRFVEGLGFSAYCNAIFTIVANEFSDHVSTTNSFIQAASEVGLMLGPSIGGFLFEIGGYGIPFYITGIVVVLNGLVLYKVVPACSLRDGEKKTSKRPYLRSGLVVVSIACLSASSSGVGFLEATLANHLAPLGLTTGIVGLFFTIIPFFFVVASPVCGYLTDVRGIQAYLFVFGQLTFGIGFYLVGPGVMFPFLSLTSWTVIIGLVFIGVSFACCTIPSTKSCVIGALESGWEESTDTYAIVMSITNSMYSFGAFFGPLMGSVLIQHQGFPFGYTVMGTWNIVVSGLSLAIYTCRYLASKNTKM